MTPATRAANTGALTSEWITGLGLDPSTGIRYANVEQLTIDLGSGGDTFTIHSTHTGTTALTTNSGTDTVIIRTVAGRHDRRHRGGCRHGARQLRRPARRHAHRHRRYR